MANILPTPSTLTKEQQFAHQVDLQIKQAAIAQKSAYDNLRKLFYGTTEKPFTNEQTNAAYAAFAANTSTGLTPEQIGQLARLTKASINLFNDTKITDSVPEATITF